MIDVDDDGMTTRGEGFSHTVETLMALPVGAVVRAIDGQEWRHIGEGFWTRHESVNHTYVPVEALLGAYGPVVNR
jgi:hypothetical protein